MQREKLKGLFICVCVSGFLFRFFFIAVNVEAQLPEHSGFFIVNSLLDEVDITPGDGLCQTRYGFCTLRAAIIEANASTSKQTIIMPPGVYSLTIEGIDEDAAMTGDLDILTDMTIIGATVGENIVIDGSGLDRVFHVMTDTHVNISSVTIQNGVSGKYSGIWDAEFPGRGGGIYNLGTLTLTDSIISDNHAHYMLPDVWGSGSMGGGIYNGGKMMIEDSLIVSNTTHCLSGYHNAGLGGGIYNQGILSIERSLIVGNISECGGLAGAGGIRNHGYAEIRFTTVVSNTSNGIGSQFIITITRSSVVGNSSSGLVLGGTATIQDSVISSNTTGVQFTCCLPHYATIENSTISDNEGGGGIFMFSGHPSVTLNLNNVTVVRNRVENSSFISEKAGGITNYNGIGTVNIRNSIVAQNEGPEFSDCSWVQDSQGYNLIGNATNCNFVPAEGDQIGTDTALLDPLMGPLQDNGGETLTHALLAGSPAIDAGDPFGCVNQQGAIISYDQRGFPRSVDGNGDGIPRCDIGAYEWWQPSSWVYLPLIVR